jgi:hypothetical protein
VIQDLRSQIVKEVCTTLALISKTTRDSMAVYLKEILPTLLEVRGSGNKVNATYCGECIDIIVSHTVIRGSNLRFFVDTLMESKNKMIRLCCITSLKLVLIHWNFFLDKNDFQQMEKALKNALYDASSSCRTASHEFFVLFQQKYTKRAAILKTTLDYKIQKRLENLLTQKEQEEEEDKEDKEKNTIDTRMSYRFASSLTIEPSGSSSGSSPSPPYLPLTKRTSSHSHSHSHSHSKMQSALDIGDRVCIPEREIFGFVRYFGLIEGVKGQWVGIELDEAVGKNDGSVKGRYYFRCSPKRGIFARTHQVILTIPGRSSNSSHAAGRGAEMDDSMSTSMSELNLTQELTREVDQVQDQDQVQEKQQEEEPALQQILTKASVLHRKYLDKLLHTIRQALEEHEQFQNFVTTASSADAIQYLQQLQNAAQEKIVFSDLFIQQIIKAQQEARES